MTRYLEAYKIEEGDLDNLKSQNIIYFQKERVRASVTSFHYNTRKGKPNRFQMLQCNLL